MKSISKAALAVCLGAFVTPVHAQSEFGGEFTLGYSTDASNTRFGKRELGVSGEFRAQSFGGQVDYSNYRLTGTSQSADGYGLHLNFSPSFGTAVGGFYAHDTGPGFGSISYYGAEAQFGVQQAEVEAHIGVAQTGGGNGTLYGVRGDFNARDGLGVYALGEHAGITGRSVTRFGIGGEVSVAERFAVNAEIGTSNVYTGGARRSGAYIGIGAQLEFGNRGATFEKRGLLSTLPGF